jgi:hypothetical protein
VQEDSLPAGEKFFRFPKESSYGTAFDINATGDIYSGQEEPAMNVDTSYYGDGFLVRRPDLPHYPWILGVQGAPYEMGFQQGILLADIIQEHASGFLTPIYAQFGGWKPDGKTAPTLNQIEAGRDVLWNAYQMYFEKPLRTTAAALYEEIIGVADGLAHAGSRVTKQDILLGNCVPELTEPCLYAGAAGAGHTDAETRSQCSDLVVWGAATTDGRLIHGANYDYNTFDVFHKYMGIIVARPERGHAFLAQCIPARVGYYRGLNEAKISVSELSSESADRDVRANPRIPHCMHMRMLMQYAASLDDAVDIMSRLMGTTGNNNIIADAKVPSALEIENSCTKLAVLRPREGTDALYNTNQSFAYPGYRDYEGDTMAQDQVAWFGVPFEEADTVEKWIEVLRRESEKRTFSWQRFEKISTLIEQHSGRIDVPTVIEMLSAFPVSRPPEEKQALAPECQQLFGIVRPIVDYRLASVFSVVFDSGSMTAHVAVGAEPAQSGTYWPLSVPRLAGVLETIRDQKLTSDSDSNQKDGLLAEALAG